MRKRGEQRAEGAARLKAQNSQHFRLLADSLAGLQGQTAQQFKALEVLRRRDADEAEARAAQRDNLLASLACTMTDLETRSRQPPSRSERSPSGGAPSGKAGVPELQRSVPMSSASGAAGGGGVPVTTFASS